MDHVEYYIKYHDFTLGPSERVPLGDISERIRDFPWEEEAAKFAAAQPTSEPSPAGPIVLLAEGRVEVNVLRPCRHLMAGDEHVEDVYRVHVYVLMRRRLLWLIPYQGCRSFQYAFPDLPRALKLVDRCLATAGDATEIVSELEGHDFAEFRL